MKFNKNDFHELLKNEIRKMLDDDMLRGPPVIGDPNYVSYVSRGDVCQDCGQSPCECPSSDSPCQACDAMPCECSTTGIMEKKLTCASCGGILVLEGDCVCGNKTLGQAATIQPDKMIMSDFEKC